MRIIHISDLHFSSSDHTFDLKRDLHWWEWVGEVGEILILMDPSRVMQDFVDSQNAQQKIDTIINFLRSNGPLLKATVVVITGDLTDSGESQDYDIAVRFINELIALGYSVYSIPGNHDYHHEGNVFWPDLLGSEPLDNPDVKRAEFAKRITAKMPNVLDHEYPLRVDLGDTLLVLLNSMAEDGGNFAQGKLGASQLNRLRQIITDARAASNRKIVVCLHHSPFVETGKAALVDAADLRDIISSKVDALLFGHTGELQQSFPHKEIELRIPIINSENLEHMGCVGVADTVANSGKVGKISIIDLNSNTIEVYSTDSVVPSAIYSGSPARGYAIQPDPCKAYEKTEISFHGGETVVMTIGGGVQHGGVGQTWKRYVNPLEKSSSGHPIPDPIHYGMISIPGIPEAASGLVPIRDLIQKYGVWDSAIPHRCILTFKIPSHSSATLQLGYKDDDYSDNSYESHDDGVFSQCSYVGSAYLIVEVAPRPKPISPAAWLSVLLLEDDKALQKPEIAPSLSLLLL